MEHKRSEMERAEKDAPGVFFKHVLQNLDIAFDMAIELLQQTEHNICPREALLHRGMKTARCENVCRCDFQKDDRGRSQCRIDRARLREAVWAAKAECWNIYLIAKAEQKQQEEV